MLTEDVKFLITTVGKVSTFAFGLYQFPAVVLNYFIYVVFKKYTYQSEPEDVLLPFDCNVQKKVYYFTNEGRGRVDDLSFFEYKSILFFVN